MKAHPRPLYMLKPILAFCIAMRYWSSSWPDLPLWLLRWRPVLSTGCAANTVEETTGLLLWPVSELVRRHRARNRPKNSHEQNGSAHCQRTKWVKTEQQTNQQQHSSSPNIYFMSSIMDNAVSTGQGKVAPKWELDQKNNENTFRIRHKKKHRNLSEEAVQDNFRQECFEHFVKVCIYIHGGLGNMPKPGPNVSAKFSWKMQCWCLGMRGLGTGSSLQWRALGNFKLYFNCSVAKTFDAANCHNICKT